MKKISELREVAKQSRPSVSKDDLAGLLEIIDRQHSVMDDVFRLCAIIRSESEFRGLVTFQKTASEIQARVVKLSAGVEK